MDATGLLSRLEPRAIGKGVAIFLLVAVLIPVVVTVAVSFGPREWLTQYLLPARRFQPVLFISAGALAALVIPRSALLNSLAAALLGSFIFLGLALAVRASPHLEATGLAFEYLVVPIAWCFVGAACVVLGKRALKCALTARW
jgi:hypothetical protein